MRLILALLCLLAAAASYKVSDNACHLLINMCLSERAVAHGYDSAHGNVWDFLNRRATSASCRAVVRPYLTNPPALAVDSDKADELLECLEAI